ncbi:MAG: thioredoxin family protein [Burkholderiales bacterium]|nr:thioredoxin family protein [Burkholderiales bacterium]MDE1928837.1 thioredoxin family protein [Burkholderiales bacterium]MDE2159413.1 thioredoxin family protein [Burkholderiales bacterium]MDE2502008.1 thioredoxin family protein [Burkholderiales bacterium]
MKLAPALFALTLVLAAGARAGTVEPYSAQTFDRLTHEGRPVVVDVSATWCPTCKAQKPIVAALMQAPANRDVTLLTVDFDADKPVLRRFKVGMQSTLIAFKGAKEVARSTGDTTAAGLAALFRKTVE